MNLQVQRGGGDDVRMHARHKNKNDWQYSRGGGHAKKNLPPRIKVHPNVIPQKCCQVGVAYVEPCWPALATWTWIKSIVVIWHVMPQAPHGPKCQELGHNKEGGVTTFAVCRSMLPGQEHRVVPV